MSKVEVIFSILEVNFEILVEVIWPASKSQDWNTALGPMVVSTCEYDTKIQIWNYGEFAQLVVLHDKCPNWWTYIMQHYMLRKFSAPLYSIRPRHKMLDK